MHQICGAVCKIKQAAHEVIARIKLVDSQHVVLQFPAGSGDNAAFIRFLSKNASPRFISLRFGSGTNTWPGGRGKTVYLQATAQNQKEYLSIPILSSHIQPSKRKVRHEQTADTSGRHKVLIRIWVPGGVHKLLSTALASVDDLLKLKASTCKSQD